MEQRIQAAISTWLPWMVSVWILGMLGLSLWNVSGWFAAQRLKSQGTSPVSTAIQQAAIRISRQLGLARPVRLFQSRLVDSPIVIGALKPAILLPASLVTTLPPDQLESLLRTSWPTCCDTIISSICGRRLSRLSSSIIRPSGGSPPKFARNERIAATTWRSLWRRTAMCTSARWRRLQRLAYPRWRWEPQAESSCLVCGEFWESAIRKPRSTWRWLTGAVVLASCGVAIALWAVDTRAARAQAQGAETDSAKSTTKKDQAESKPAAVTGGAKRRCASNLPDFPTKGSMRIQIVDTAGKPLEKAQIRASIWTPDKKFKANREYTTDPQGFATIQLPKSLQILRLWADEDGYCGKFKNFQTDSAVHVLVIPDDFKFQLVKAVTIGGLVKDQAGGPIQGARIKRAHGENVIWGRSTFTNREGRWKFDDEEPETADRIKIRVTHPDYLSDRLGGELQREQQITYQALRDQTAAITLRPGLRVSGKVTDPAGKPYPRAIVIWGDDLKSLPGERINENEAPTNSDGIYRLPVFGPGPVRVTVIAEGWMPESRIINIAEKTQSTDFQLRPGRKLASGSSTMPVLRSPASGSGSNSGAARVR